jgi:MFS family permease
MDIEQAKWHKRRWIALVFLGFSLLVISLDTTVVNLALPSISKELGSSSSGLQWIVDAYILVFASSLLTLGSIGDRIGRKRTLQIGLIAFGLFSLGGALSTSTGMLIGMRALMGLAGAAMMPSTLSILTATFREPKERAQAIAMWAAVFALGSGLGPLVGGYLLEHFQWEAVFLINLPIVAIALMGGYFFVQDSRDEHPRKVDVRGSLLSIAGLFALVYGIIEVHRGEHGPDADLIRHVRDHVLHEPVLPDGAGLQRTPSRSTPAAYGSYVLRRRGHVSQDSATCRHQGGGRNWHSDSLRRPLLSLQDR